MLKKKYIASALLWTLFYGPLGVMAAASHFEGFHVGLALGGGQTSGKLKADYSRVRYVKVEAPTTYDYSAFSFAEKSSSSNNLGNGHFNGALFLKYLGCLTNDFLWGVGLRGDFLSYKKSRLIEYTGVSRLTTKTPPLADVIDDADVTSNVDAKITSSYVFEPFMVLGATFNEEWFFYGKIGPSFMNIKLVFSAKDSDNLSLAFSKQKLLTGIVGGLGISYALTNNITVGVEGLYRSYGSFKTGTVQDSGKTTTFSGRVNPSSFVGNVVISYHF